MTDYFALLDQPRRPWLDTAKLDEKFHELSKRLHPDKVGRDSGSDRHFAELNAAYQCLRVPKTRLEHLLQLESAHKAEATGPVPRELADLFMGITQQLREADAFLSKWTGASALLKAGLFTGSQEMIEQLRTLQRELQQRTTELDKRLMVINQNWTRPTTEDIAELQKCHQVYGFFTKWIEQLGNRITRLMV